MGMGELPPPLYRLYRIHNVEEPVRYKIRGPGRYVFSLMVTRIMNK